MSESLIDRMHQHLAALKAQRDTILAQSRPLREQRDRLVNETRAKDLALKVRIMAMEEPLFQLDRDIAMLARALGGRRIYS